MPSFQAEPCCPCGTFIAAAPVNLPDIDILAKFSPLYPSWMESFNQSAFDPLNSINARGTTETIAESPPGRPADHLSLCHRLNI